jgi:hypothetical protein
LAAAALASDCAVRLALASLADIAKIPFVN